MFFNGRSVNKSLEDLKPLYNARQYCASLHFVSVQAFFLFVREMWWWKNWMEINGNEFYDGEIGYRKY